MTQNSDFSPEQVDMIAAFTIVKAGSRNEDAATIRFF